MSKFKSYTDKDGNKVKIGDFVEVVYKEGEVAKIGKVSKITNETFWALSVVLEGNPTEHIIAKNTRKHVSKGVQVSWNL
jgi:hypothetical protein